MRWIALAVILASLPAFIAFLSQNKERRDQALIAVGLFCFASGSLQIDAALYTWPMWNGTVKGVMISPIDTLCLALIFTRKSHNIYFPVMALIAIFAIPIALSIAVSGSPIASSFTLIQLIRMAIFVIAVGGEVHRPGALRNLMIGLSVGLMIQGGFVAYQKLNGVIQAAGTMSHQNILGLMVELAVLPLIAAVLEGERSKWIYGGIVGGMIVVAGGGSRGTMAFVAAGVIALVILSLARGTSARKMQMVGGAALGALVFVPLALNTLNDRFGEHSFVTAENERAAFKRAATAMADDHPLGVGANTYVAVSNTGGYAARAGVNWNAGSRAAPVHNAYLLARAETGWGGQIALMILLGMPLLIGLKVAFSKPRDPFGGIALGSAAAIFALIVHNNFEYVWFVELPQRIFFLNVAIIAACAVARKKGITLSEGSEPAAASPAKKSLVWRPGQPVNLARGRMVGGKQA